MARYGKIEDRGSETGQPRSAAGPRGAEEEAGASDTAIGHLPGVVNDLPEVAPHEWIYLMS